MLHLPCGRQLIEALHVLYVIFAGILFVKLFCFQQIPLGLCLRIYGSNWNIGIGLLCSNSLHSIFREIQQVNEALYILQVSFNDAFIRLYPVLYKLRTYIPCKDTKSFHIQMTAAIHLLTFPGILNTSPKCLRCFMTCIEITDIP